MRHPQTSFESSQAYLAAEYGRAPEPDTLPPQAAPLSQDRGVRLEIRGLSKRYGKRQVLQHTELVIEPGEFVAIVGRSGCGKSTLLRLVAGLEAATQGSIRLDGQDVTGLREDTRIMFQDSRLLPWRRVIDNVALGLPRAGHAAAADVLAQVGLGDRQPDWPARLSGGQRQRVSLARALVHNPRLLLLDEPLGALDALTRIEMHQLIEGLWQRNGFTALLVTHDVQEAVALADRVILIEDGRIALDERVRIARPRERSDPLFGQIEKKILDRVLQQPGEAISPGEPLWPNTPVHGVRWAV
ncbi:ATP-binding cassette domain-containing protein [Polaromonas sp. YR568]|uniref:ATP-binding cassette domain-containing protein n=1 Tax=Polaromonas sp. YR568 TaxID=1855301 RepID=UPI00398BC7CE